MTDLYIVLQNDLDVWKWRLPQNWTEMQKIAFFLLLQTNFQESSACVGVAEVAPNAMA